MYLISFKTGYMDIFHHYSINSYFILNQLNITKDSYILTIDNKPINRCGRGRRYASNTYRQLYLFFQLYNITVYGFTT